MTISQIAVILRRRAFLADPSRLLNLSDFSTTVSSRSESIPTVRSKLRTKFTALREVFFDTFSSAGLHGAGAGGTNRSGTVHESCTFQRPRRMSDIAGLQAVRFQHSLLSCTLCRSSVLVADA